MYPPRSSSPAAAWRPPISNAVVAVLNLVTLLASVPIIAAGLWLSSSSSHSCASFLHAPLLAVGVVALVVSLAGFLGACCHLPWALRIYLAFLALLVAALLAGMAFAFSVTAAGGGVQVPARQYREYRLDEYSGWLRQRVADGDAWRATLSCVTLSGACAKLAGWTPMDYLQHDLTPVQSGCCKPPTACAYAGGMPTPNQDSDCYRWNNAADVLCYGCDSCKAGVLEQVRRHWHKVSIAMAAVMVALIVISAVGCRAFRNVQRGAAQHHHQPANGMHKINPRWDYYWGRWWRGRRDQLY